MQLLVIGVLVIKEKRTELYISKPKLTTMDSIGPNSSNLTFKRACYTFRVGAKVGGMEPTLGTEWREVNIGGGLGRDSLYS